MKLSRLEISGFKSFPDRADLAFDHGVTAIVGPNGCGKSNVMDAITWVLGEQSAKSLRGDRMEDVIFSGSDARRPTAAAEVRLRLSGVQTQAVRRAADRVAGMPEPLEGEDKEAAGEQFELPTTEMRDVEVSRRLYRSGESEYLIDGEVCRLHDVQDLLMDAGLGVKAYAVIEQGKIGQILSAKAGDRRQLIEEAAGVTKYKSRRRTAELKLEQAQQNLNRIEDIIFEIEKQRASLKRQAAKARRYRRLRDEMRRWEKVLIARRHQVLAQAIESARARLADARAREREAAGRVTAAEHALEGLRLRLNEAETASLAAREAAHARELEVGRRQQQLDFARQQVETLAAAATEIAAEIELLEARREPARLEIEARREAERRAAAERNEAAAVLADEDRAHAAGRQSVEALESGVDELRQRVIAAQNTTATLRHVIERASEARERLVADIARLEAEASDLRLDRDRAAAERADAQASLAAVEEAMAASRLSRSSREAALAGLRTERVGLTQALRTCEHELTAATARLQSLEELDHAREGYGEAARAILADASAGLRHLGAVADYLETDRQHERAIEAALGDALQAVVVESRDEAARGLELVRARGLGRCTFLVLAAPDAPTRFAGPAPDGVRPLASVVRFVGDVGQRVGAALGEAFVADSFAAASDAAARTAAPVSTLAGDVFRGASLASGGGRPGARGILAAKREIKDLREQIANERRESERLASETSAIEAKIAEHELALAELGSELHSQEKAAVAYQMQVTRAEGELARLNRSLEQVGNERRRAEEESVAQLARHDEAQVSVTRVEGEHQSLGAELGAVQRRLQDAREQALALSQRAGDARARHAALGERAAALATDVQRLEAAAQELVARITARVDERSRNMRRREELALAIEQDNRQLALDREALATEQQRVRDAEAGLAALHLEVEGGEGSARDARADLDEIRAAASQLEIARATAEADLTHLASSCVETLGAAIDEVVAEVEALEQLGEVAPDPAIVLADEPDGDEEVGAPASEFDRGETDGREGAAVAVAAAPVRTLTAEEAIAELKAKIDRLGPVNMMAIEQFDELEHRHAFLTTQRRDLVDSIAQAGEAIKRIDETSKARFREAFAAINRSFEETFTTLFGGGRAGLVLLDESDLLESGVDIIAQPPGKRLQSVQLLSGGEKALTAMALMFAIFRYRPSPFCLLDEIDAPLDDANIGRFLEMLRGMMDHTQFVLITHSRKTMEIADRLYGVTMEEPGVSKLISLKLN